MDRMLYVAMNGAKQALVSQAANSHNLANVNTAGFRQDLYNFQSIEAEGAGLNTRAYVMTEGPGVSHQPGPVNTTGRDLDVAINGDGFLAVQAPDGTEAYTRAGDLRLSNGGILTTGAGHPVIGSGGPIALEPAESIVVATDGTISIRPLGAAPDETTPVERLKLVNPDLSQLVKGEDGLLRLRDGGFVSADASVTVAPGAREGSNVNAVEAMVNMIALSRNYELNVRMMRVAEENDAAEARLLNLNL